MPRALLLQLPAADFRWPLLDTNQPLAAGYLAAYARRAAPEWSVDILPWQESDLLGDGALLNAILACSPDLVGFSVYLWNAERSLHLAHQLRRAGVGVVLGGPELSPDNGWLCDAAAGLRVVEGEGEAAFAALLLGQRPGVAPVDLASLPSPYLEGPLAPYPDGTLWLETVRGCPFRCRYCNYGKRHGRPRSFPPGWLRQHLEWALAQGAREVYLMDPSFNVRADWAELLEGLEQANPERVLRLHTELVADHLRPGDGSRLAGAGLASCELGLQSVHPEVLLAAGRSWQREAWLRSARELVDAGVDTVAGLILGLPGDTPQGFHDSVEFLLAELPGAEIQVFPLAVLPGTDLRSCSRQLGLHHQPRPPYLVEATPGYEDGALGESLLWFEERTGLELDPQGPPALAGDWTGGESGPYLSGLLLQASQGALQPGWVDLLLARGARHLTLWLKGWDPAFPEQLERLLRAAPHAVVSVALDTGAGWPLERLRQLLAAGSGEHYLDRAAVHLFGAGARTVPRLVALLCPDDARLGEVWLAALRSSAEVVWKAEVATGWVARVEALAVDGEAVLVRGEPDTVELNALAAGQTRDRGELLFGAAQVDEQWRQRCGDRRLRAPEYRAQWS